MHQSTCAPIINNVVKFVYLLLADIRADALFLNIRI